MTILIGEIISCRLARFTVTGFYRAGPILFTRESLLRPHFHSSESDTTIDELSIALVDLCFSDWLVFSIEQYSERERDHSRSSLTSFIKLLSPLYREEEEIRVSSSSHQSLIGCSSSSSDPVSLIQSRRYRAVCRGPCFYFWSVLINTSASLQNDSHSSISHGQAHRVDTVFLRWDHEEWSPVQVLDSGLLYHMLNVHLLWLLSRCSCRFDILLDFDRYKMDAGESWTEPLLFEIASSDHWSTRERLVGPVKRSQDVQESKEWNTATEFWLERLLCLCGSVLNRFYKARQSNQR